MTREQFISLVSEEQEKLRRFLLALCLGNRTEADDIAQETLMKAYLSSSGYQDFGKFTAWLYKIASNTFIDYKRNIRNSVSLDDVAQIADSQFSADRKYEYQDLYAALGTLSPSECTPILLYYIKGYSMKEIGGILDCSEDAVKMRLSRGREHLRLKLKK